MMRCDQKSPSSSEALPSITSIADIAYHADAGADSISLINTVMGMRGTTKTNSFLHGSTGGMSG